MISVRTTEESPRTCDLPIPAHNGMKTEIPDVYIPIEVPEVQLRHALFPNGLRIRCRDYLATRLPVSPRRPQAAVAPCIGSV